MAQEIKVHLRGNDPRAPPKWDPHCFGITAEWQWKWNGNGMEMEMEWKWQWKWKWNEMEIEMEITAMAMAGTAACLPRPVLAGICGTSGARCGARPGPGGVLQPQLLAGMGLRGVRPLQNSPALFQHSSGCAHVQDSSCRPEPCRAGPGLTLNTERALIRLSYNSSPNTRESSLSTLCPGTKSR